MTGKTLSARLKPQAETAPSDSDQGETGAATAPASTSAAASPGPASSGKGQNLQDAFLNLLRRNKMPVTMFLVKGVKLQGIVTWFDNFSILLRRDGQSQLVYKHAISTIMPSAQIPVSQFQAPVDDNGRKPRLLQEVFLSSVRDAGVSVTMFLVNGVMLQGKVAAYDLFCMLLEREGYVQLAYKHAVSTIQPAGHVDLSGDWDGEDSSR
ncbi:RNA chaperone Hfq [Novosphingobium sp.]|uniref:RNA chaperone Hfq n=1 Tax=Novosphingobium sp. TaxID=1874826 RepID=UPI0025EC2781|nr:RNA chaperone Hfq [Novosphingobium sp.]